jgi:hypothetical protein
MNNSHSFSPVCQSGPTLPEMVYLADGKSRNSLPGTSVTYGAEVARFAGKVLQFCFAAHWDDLTVEQAIQLSRKVKQKCRMKAGRKFICSTLPQQRLLAASHLSGSEHLSKCNFSKAEESPMLPFTGKCQPSSGGCPTKVPTFW